MSQGVIQWGEATAARSHLSVVDLTVTGELSVTGDATVEGTFATEGAAVIDGADLSIPNLPAVDPQVAGQAFQNSDDVLEISAGA